MLLTYRFLPRTVFLYDFSIFRMIYVMLFAMTLYYLDWFMVYEFFVWIATFSYSAASCLVLRQLYFHVYGNMERIPLRFQFFLYASIDVEMYAGTVYKNSCVFSMLHCC